MSRSSSTNSAAQAAVHGQGWPQTAQAVSVHWCVVSTSAAWRRYRASVSFQAFLDVVGVGSIAITTSTRLC
ncbi:hypothetical protein [Kutzneria kofuensis]|jgi:hypothetical protein|uniref:Uncharacterized protein n=1 Tax=Kutzneria kofuensis TaxID=103725 RepID=A0A7W9KJD8_9PSEU|nr:hypothetical protein [Kutzneria kofuensis]MBB5893373.1 hypothetical protein [Kutzneria kofuensis]